MAGPATWAPRSPGHKTKAPQRPQSAGPGSGPKLGLGLVPRGSRLAEAVRQAADPFVLIEASAMLLCASERSQELAAYMAKSFGPSHQRRPAPPAASVHAAGPQPL